MKEKRVKKLALRIQGIADGLEEMTVSQVNAMAALLMDLNRRNELSPKLLAEIKFVSEQANAVGHLVSNFWKHHPDLMERICKIVEENEAKETADDLEFCAPPSLN